MENTLHKLATKEDIDKLLWCFKIVNHLLEFDSWTIEQAFDLAENLHYTHVVEEGDKDCDPIECLLEELTCWGD